MNYLKGKHNLNDTVELANYINSCISELNKIEDDILREITLKKLANEAKIDEELLRSKLVKLEKPKTEVKKRKVLNYDKYEIAQRNLIFYMLHSTEVIKKLFFMQ